ncbi:aspartate ammonia-lyase [Ferrovibrio sp.]|uniref:aspartate ammonia-lyase n=1 Tax=Ferrovibrio sp. TaxID=1917215 RepID=UPI001B405D1B|nr:aspartate ammonia-lyase [Ferrovibrio sp.]MBP7065663.1 aspartate ammonia-lyase [Ferrovibrio sp.]
MTGMRLEHDSLGEREIPADAYYGVQTQRALDNFRISGIGLNHYPHLIRAFGMVKKAAAAANTRLGYLAPEKNTAIAAACDDLIDGRLHEWFTIDVFQGGAGTSTNMNVNEVVANRGLELLGHAKGEYAHLHPNDDVNLSQSTNDAYPTAVRLATLLSHAELSRALEQLAGEFRKRGEEFTSIVKLGRTQLQDAVPMTLGQEFEAFAINILEDVARGDETVRLFHEVNLGGTAVGTGINTDPDYSALAIAELARVSGLPMVRAANLIEASWDMGAFVLYSGMLKRVAVKLSKIANDLRLLSSGPRGGLNEINLPPMQPGSSIMPGKVNPVIPEVVNQVCFQVIGNDMAVTMAAEAGQLQLNVMEPLIVHNVMHSLQLLVRAARTLAELCVAGITANEDYCRRHVEASIGLVTALNPYIGYERSAALAKEAIKTGRTIRELVLEKGWVDAGQIDTILDLAGMTQPRKR